MAQRTGLRTLHALIKKACQLFADYGFILYQIVPADKHVYLNALSQACTDFVVNVDVETILGDEQ